MSFQPFLSDAPNEEWIQDKIDQYQEEATLFGYPVKYMRATEISEDDVFQESTARDFLEANAHNMFIKKDEDSFYSGDEMYGGIGLLPSYEAIYYISVKYFTDLGFDPLEGDLIQDEIGTIFEITKVDTLAETQESLRINDIILARKVYLKQYQANYRDDIDDTLLDDIEDEFKDEDLDDLNSALDDMVTNKDIIDKTETDTNKLFEGW